MTTNEGRPLGAADDHTPNVSAPSDTTGQPRGWKWLDVCDLLNALAVAFAILAAALLLAGAELTPADLLRIVAGGAP